MATTSTKEIESASSSPLLRLPAEVRNQIYECATDHEEGNGVIAPLPDDPYQLVAIIVAGKRLQCLPAGIAILCDAARIAHQGSFDQTEDHNEEMEELIDLWKNYANFQEMPFFDPDDIGKEDYQLHQAIHQRKGHLHLCRLDCLAQPPITRVNRQLRKESLSMFYASNKFHLEMHHFGPRKLTDWWRAAGDTNIGKIADISLVFNDEWQPFNRPLIVSIKQGRGLIEDKNVTNRSLAGMLALWKSVRALESGLHVRGIERIIAVRAI